ncbi:MAG: hypothetical protein HC780_16370 [Leptolyngbyaceae cyanobacterium CSU_1_3]|nr:hypothetical protein [Leptolyngbyaceae cyanobacterium CSU_1_3]
MFNKLVLAITITFSLSYFAGISSPLPSETSGEQLRVAQAQITTLMAIVPWRK